MKATTKNSTHKPVDPMIPITLSHNEYKLLLRELTELLVYTESDVDAQHIQNTMEASLVLSLPRKDVAWIGKYLDRHTFDIWVDEWRTDETELHQHHTLAEKFLDAHKHSTEKK